LFSELFVADFHFLPSSLIQFICGIISTKSQGIKAAGMSRSTLVFEGGGPILGLGLICKKCFPSTISISSWNYSGGINLLNPRALKQTKFSIKHPLIAK
jgi:hypothetical protein